MQTAKQVVEPEKMRGRIADMWVYDIDTFPIGGCNPDTRDTHPVEGTEQIDREPIKAPIR